MKTQVITAEAVCGMQVNLNIFDQDAITNLVKEVDSYYTAREIHDKWHNDQYDDNLRIKVDPDTGEKTELWKRYDWDAYRALYPEPNDPSLDKDKIIKTVMVFLRKLTIADGERATVFSEESK